MPSLEVKENKVAIGEHETAFLEAGDADAPAIVLVHGWPCLLYTSPSPRDVEESRMPSSA